MAFLEATGLLGTFHIIANILDSIRKCYKSKKKIGALVDDRESSLNNIYQLAPQVSRFVELGGICIGDFCAIAGKIIKMEVDLLNITAKMHKENKILNQMNKMFLFCSATETVTGLESIYRTLAHMETGMRLLIASVESNVKVSVLVEVFEPVLALVEEIIPHIGGLKEKQQLLEDTRTVFGTHVLSSRMNRLVSQTTESVYCFILGKMFFEGMAVEVNYEKSASFFKRAIEYGNSEALAYLGRQHSYGLGMREDEEMAAQLYMWKTRNLYTKWGNVRCTDMAAAESGDEDALCRYGFCMLHGNGVAKNAKVAVELFKIGVSAGSMEARLRLADCLYYGLGVSEDKAMAFSLYREAQDHNLRALARAGLCLVKGSGVARNVLKGLRCLKNAAAGGNGCAYLILAHLYRNGIGVPKNKRKALLSCKRSLAAGNWPANLLLGEMYRDGEGVAPNMKKAIHHFEISAKYEEDIGHWNLACVYQSEDGHVNKNRALYHFRFAADFGNRKARQVVGEHFVSVSGPRQLSFTHDELNSFLGNLRSQFSRRITVRIITDGNFGFQAF